MWDISVPERTVLTLEFPNGLAELSGVENCPNSLQYSVGTTKSDGTVKTQRYCKSGTVSYLELFGTTTVNIDVPKEEVVEGTPFTVKATPRGKSLLCFHWKLRKPFLFIYSKMSSHWDWSISLNDCQCWLQLVVNQISYYAESSWLFIDYRLNAKLRMQMHSRLNMYCRIPLYLVKKDFIACQKGMVCGLPSNGKLEKRKKVYPLFTLDAVCLRQGWGLRSPSGKIGSASILDGWREHAATS